MFFGGTELCQHQGCLSQAAILGPVYDPGDLYGDDEGLQYRCLDHTFHGPWENPHYCRDCRTGYFDCTCPMMGYCNICQKEVTIIDGGCGPGFAAAHVSWEKYDCGHTWVDEEADMRAAI